MLQAEIRKLITTRTVHSLVIGAIAVAGVGAFSTSMSAHPDTLQEPLHSQEMYLLSSINVSLFALILGIRSFTDEFRHNTVAWTIMAVRHRWRVVATKSTVSALAAAAMALLALTTVVAIAVAVANAKGTTVGLTSSDLTAGAGLVMAAAAWSVIGTAIGALVRHQVAAIVGAVIWVYAVENLAAGFLGNAGRLLPGAAAHSVGNATAATNLASTTIGIAVLLTYTTVLLIIAAMSLERRELAPAS